MEKNLTEAQVTTILKNAPKGTDPNKIVEGLVNRGYILQGFNDQPEQPKNPQGDQTGVVGKAKALAGGFAEGIGATLIPQGIEYLGKKAVDTFGTDQMKQNMANATPIAQQFADVTHQTENPITAGVGNVAGLASGLVTGTTEAKAIPVVAKALEARQATKTSSFIKDLITPELTTKATAEAIKTGKVTEAGLKGSRDITQSVPFFNETQKAVAEVKGISPKKTLLENANAIHDHIGTVADDLITQVGKSKAFFNPNEFKGYMSGVKQTLSENPTLVGDAEKTASKILTKFESLVKEHGYTPKGLLQARKGLDSWMKTQKGAKVFDPNTENAVSIALRAIRQGGNDFLANKVPDIAVKDLLSKQTNLYNAIEAIAPKAAKEGANTFERWIKSHPKVTGLLKLGGAAVVGGGTVGVISQ